MILRKLSQKARERKISNRVGGKVLRQMGRVALVKTEMGMISKGWNIAAGLLRQI